jgi:aminopeptidase N
MDTLTGVARIEARATQNLSSFNLDLDDLTVRSVRVNGHRARWTHADGELTITPSRGLRDHKRFAVRIAYDGIPQTLPDFLGVLPHGRWPARGRPAPRRGHLVPGERPSE